MNIWRNSGGLRAPRISLGWAALALSIAIYVGASVAIHQPFHIGGLRLEFFDLRIYHLGALRLMHGTALYGAPMLHHLGFTYPPFAALVLAPLAWLPLDVDELIVTGLNLALLVFIMRRALMLVPNSARPRGWADAAGLAAAALCLEPISTAIGYGQVDLLITALVIFDLSRPDAARSKGLAIGIAAAIKLTPLVFIPYLLFSRRGRAAAVATVSFFVSIALSFAVVPADASTYWFHEIFKTSRIGYPMQVANQSLSGMIDRLTTSAHPGPAWECLIVLTALSGLALAVRASRRGDEAAGFSLAAITTLLISPISWSHHWTLAMPALALFGLRAWERRSRRLMAAAIVLVLAATLRLPEIAAGQFRTTRGVLSLATTDPYPAIGVLVVASYAVALATSRRRAQSRSSGSRDAVALRPSISPRSLNPGLR